MKRIWGSKFMGPFRCYRATSAFRVRNCARRPCRLPTIAPSPTTPSALLTSLPPSKPPILSIPSTSPTSPPEPLPIHGQSKFEDIGNLGECTERYQPDGYHPVKPGETFQDGKYKVIRKLGNGSCSTVWLAVSADKPRYVTLKILMPNHKSSETEILIHKHLSENASEDPRSRHVTALLDEFQHEGPNGKHRCLAFEPMGATATSLVDYLTGNNPNIELLDKNNPPEEEYSDENDSEEEYFDQDNPQIIYSAVRYPKWIAQKILGHALRGLAFLHRNGIVHGDLHPGNILFSIDNIHTMGENELLQDEASTKIVVRRVGEERGRSTPMTLFLAQYLHKHIKLDSRLVIKLSDLGASFWVDSPPKQTETPIALRSPEEIFGQNIGTGIDIWVFGCLMFEFLTGNKLFSVIKWGPDPEAQESADDGHIMQLNEIISPLPDAMMELWPRSSECYGPNSEALNPFGDEDAYVCDSIEKKFHNEKLPEIDDEEEAILMSIMQQILVYDPKMRPSAEELLKHPWFADQEVDGPQQAMD